MEDSQKSAPSSPKSSPIAIIIIVVILLAGSALAFKKLAPGLLGRGLDSIEPGESQEEGRAPTVVPTSQTQVSLTKDGFVPQTVTVKTGAQIVWTNNSDTDATVNSDDHPSHLKFPELNLGKFSSGKTLSLTLKTPGTYTYHDHFHPSFTGTIVVQ